jgi:two-component system, OmpR family, sensor histidine kinase KdpD
MRYVAVFDPTLPHPFAGTTTGVVIVAALVPLLSLWHGASGPLGQSIPLIFLVPVLLTASVAGKWPGVIVAVTAISVWDWFFIQPVHLVRIASARDVVALVVFLALALLTGQLAGIARQRTRDALRRAATDAALYQLTVALLGRRDLGDVLGMIAESVRSTFHLQACAVLLNDTGKLWRTVASAGVLPDRALVEVNRDVAATTAWVGRHNQSRSFGRDGGSGAVPGARDLAIHLLPLRVDLRTIGVLELVYRPGREPDEEAQQSLETMTNAIALALEQERLSQEEREAELARERDRLKSALLSSVSHDLRTPLAGIKAASSSLLQDDVRWSDADRRAFLTDIDTEADRLSRLVSNLLDLSRIESGALEPRLEWEDAAELLLGVQHRLTPRVHPHALSVEVDADLPAIRLDAVQIEQVLTNLIENAAKYAPLDTPIHVGVSRVSDPGRPACVRIAVSDRGPGIPAREQSRIFDPFYRITSAGRRAGGTGMGLAIVKGFVDAHGGTVNVHDEEGGGSTFVVTLPVDSLAPSSIAGPTDLAESMS